MITGIWKVLLFTGGAAVAAAGVAYVAGLFDPYMADADRPVQAARAVGDAAEAGKQAEAGTAAAMPNPGQQSAGKPMASEPASKQPSGPKQADTVAPPRFDIVRVEPDGSLVVAGKAEPGSRVEVVVGSRVLGEAEAGPDGDFAIVLDNPLDPGDYQLVLRAKRTDGTSVTSTETAVVAVPESEDGQVLALVEEPGEASKLITLPQAAPSQAAKTAEPVQAPSEPAAASPAKPPESQPLVAKSGSSQEAQAPEIAVDAVEIEGRDVFVAGTAKPGQRVRVYANDILLGESRSAPSGRFLIETQRDLPVGDYIVRADGLDETGSKVAARAAVPFEREAGEAVAAVAPSMVKPAEEAGKLPAGAAKQGAKPSEAVAAASPATEITPTAPKLQRVDDAVIIRRGDTLWRISRRVYGRGVRYSTIYLANQDQIRNPDLIWPGQVFAVPEKTQEGETADLTAIKDQITRSTRAPM